VAAVTAMLVGAPAIAAWELIEPVEIVVAVGAGGASDQMARMMQAAIQKNSLMKQPTCSNSAHLNSSRSIC
jgi:tripartite-type tricarboxylate transporter receptor subunit TctC